MASAAIGPLLVAVVFCVCGGVHGEEGPKPPLRPPLKPLWLAVGRETLVEPIEPLAEYRRQEGFEAMVSTQSVQEALVSAPRRPDLLLLVGDDQPGREAAAWYLPAKRRDLYRWRLPQREQFASDAAWGDTDGNLLPEIAVGRIPARTAAEVESAVDKILAFERRPASPADLRMPVWAGAPMYGGLIDATATGLLLAVVRTGSPRWASPWILTGNPSHPLCGWPPEQPELFTRQIVHGGLCSVLMGHGGVDRFFSMRHQGATIAYRASDAQHLLSQGPPAGPMILFCCESGDFTRAEPCLAEAMFALPGGPVATLAATTESHPLTNYFSGTSLLVELAGGEDRIGRLWLAAERRGFARREFLMEHLLRDVEGKLEENIDVAKLRRDQVLMYALLGDPATRLKLPAQLDASIERTADGWRWTAGRVAGAEGLQVGFRPDNPPEAASSPAATERHKALATFEAANAARDFVPLDSPPDEGAWQGIVAEPGLLRLVTVVEGRLHVAVLEAE